METLAFFDSIRSQLLTKRQHLAGWLGAAPQEELQTRLGPANTREVQACLHDLDAAIAKAADGALGICKVCHDYVNGRLLMMDYNSCVCLDHYSPRERRQLEWDLEQSQVVQRALLPQEAPDTPGMDIAAFSQPAQIVGGDYFDFFHYEDGAPGLAIADVAGHGLSSSLIMANVQSALHTLAPLSRTPTAIMQGLNRFFCRNVHFTTFVTMFVGRFEPGDRTLSYVNAGHNPPLVVHGGNGASAPTWLRPTAAAIGLLDEAAFGMNTVSLHAGDVLLLYTDGVTEAIDAASQEFGDERLADFVSQHAQLPAPDLVAGIYRRLVDFTGNHRVSDDTTLVAFKMLPEKV